jgi:D-threonate/D-erythronate kinase
MAHHRILVLADDLTGALEVGSKFAAAGVKSLVRTGPGLSPRDLHDALGALVVDSETRHLGSTEAARRIHELAHSAYTEGFPIVYKKTDSALRGNIGAELAALIEAYSGSPLLYVPAYPQMGRTVKNCSLYVDGVLVGDTCFAIDPLNCVKESHIPTLLAANAGCRCARGRLRISRIQNLGAL